MKNKWVLSLFLLIVFLSACNSNSPETPEKTETIAQEFNVKSINGQTINLSEKKPTLIYFMATWCPTCVGLEKVFAQIHEQYGDKVQLLTVDVDPSIDTKEQLAQFQKKYGGNWPHVLDENQEITKQFQVKQLEEVALINKKGEQVFQDVNPSFEKLKSALSDIGVQP
ncbi:TlpA family protein disulfide reductase [Virgibacillus byunsanensis]|uniref:TlpA family protein disulfide reductase n=1 Tax=Virgibacillus byunsanensis TaxID=570945 RepID=A0ABW3LGW4_9BACI